MYDTLIDEKRIRFITFHQSFGYEEFIEGLRAETSDDGNVRYDIKPGVFKQICEDASFGNAAAQLALDDALEKFKAQCAEKDTIVLKTTNGSVFRVSYANNSTFRVFPPNPKTINLIKAIQHRLKIFVVFIRGRKRIFIIFPTFAASFNI
jgi:5-methylcytosine-specific restriction protein B